MEDFEFDIGERAPRVRRSASRAEVESGVVDSADNSPVAVAVCCC